MHWWEGLVAGFVATLVMTALMQMGTAMGMTRMNMAVMLGSMLRRDADSARRLGMTLHLINGLVFGVAYAVAWWIPDPSLDSAWWIGLLFGAVHGFVAMAMTPVMSGMHPRVATAAMEAGETPGQVVLPRFGFGGAGFGSLTPLGILMGHPVFGLVWGLVFSWLV